MYGHVSQLGLLEGYRCVVNCSIVMASSRGLQRQHGRLYFNLIDAERWQSGLSHLLAKEEISKGVRGFESHPLRHRPRAPLALVRSGRPMSTFRQVFDEAWARLAALCRDCADRHERGEAHEQDYRRFHTELRLLERHFVAAFPDMDEKERGEIRNLIAFLRSIGKDDFARNARRVAHRLESLPGIALKRRANRQASTQPEAAPLRKRTPVPLQASPPHIAQRMKVFGNRHQYVILTISALLALGGTIWLALAVFWPAPAKPFVPPDVPNGNSSSTAEQPADHFPSDNDNSSLRILPTLTPRSDLSASTLDAARRQSPLALLEYLDQHFSRAPEGRALTDQVLTRSMELDAPWRNSGLSSAMAAVIAVHAGLAAYPSSDAILPSEVMKEQGAEAKALGVAWWYLAARLGLEVTDIQIGTTEDGTTIVAPRLRNGVIFHTNSREFRSKSYRSLDATMIDIALHLVARDAGQGSPEMYGLACSLAEMGADRAAIDVLQARFRNVWLAMPTRSVKQQELLVNLLQRSSPGDVDAATIIAAINALGDRAGVEWFRRAFDLHGDAMLGEQSLAELTLRHVLGAVHAGTARVEAEYLATLTIRAIGLTPKRERILYAILRTGGRTDVLEAVATERYHEGERGIATLTILAERELSAGRRLEALSIIGLAMRTGEAWDVEDLPLARQGIALAIDLDQWDIGKEIAERARSIWPDDPPLRRLHAELVLATGARAEGLHMLREYLVLFPQDAAALKRLKELDGS